MASNSFNGTTNMSLVRDTNSRQIFTTQSVVLALIDTSVESAIGYPGRLVYNPTKECLYYSNGVEWFELCGADSHGNIIIGGTGNELCQFPDQPENDAILAGLDNTVCGTETTIIGGTLNQTCNESKRSNITGGLSNKVCGFDSGVYEGNENIVGGETVTPDFILPSDKSVISGGFGNFIGSNSIRVDSSGIFSGRGNTVSEQQSTIVGGDTNTISGTLSGIIGGSSNTVTTSRSIALGGNTLTISGTNSGVMAGFTNTVSSGSNNIVTGGEGNTASGTDALISGGKNNTVSSGVGNSIVGGEDNSSSLDYSSILGGLGNTVSNRSSVVLAGETNTISEQKSGILAGETNTISNQYGGIVGGLQNTISGLKSGILSGEQNTASGDYSSISGGFKNSSVGLRTGVIGGTNNNAFNENGSIVGGINNATSGTDNDNSSIIGGTSNTSLSSENSVIVGGFSNQVSSSDNGAVVGGFNNNLTAERSVILGGSNNKSTHIGSVVTGNNNVSHSTYTIETKGDGTNDSGVVFSDGINFSRTLSTETTGPNFISNTLSFYKRAQAVISLSYVVFSVPINNPSSITINLERIGNMVFMTFPEINFDLGPGLSLQANQYVYSTFSLPSNLSEFFPPSDNQSIFMIKGNRFPIVGLIPEAFGVDVDGSITVFPNGNFQIEIGFDVDDILEVPIVTNSWLPDTVNNGWPHQTIIYSVV